MTPGLRNDSPAPAVFFDARGSPGNVSTGPGYTYTYPRTSPFRNTSEKKGVRFSGPAGRERGRMMTTLACGGTLPSFFENPSGESERKNKARCEITDDPPTSCRFRTVRPHSWDRPCGSARRRPTRGMPERRSGIKDKAKDRSHGFPKTSADRRRLTETEGGSGFQKRYRNGSDLTEGIRHIPVRKRLRFKKVPRRTNG